MPSFDYLELPVSGARSLAWRKDCLVDWLGSKVYGLDGSQDDTGVGFGYRFDAVVQIPNGEYEVLYERLGTKGVVLRDGKFIREINRSFNCADDYEFPIVLFTLPDGRAAIAHCPEEYNKIEIDLLETGERLTRRPEGRSGAADVFHSGLAVDAAGAWLLSAGWVWHPFYHVSIYPVAAALEDPALLDGDDGGVRHRSELSSAAFVTDDLVVLASDPETEIFHETSAPDAERPGMLGLYRPSAKSWVSQVVLHEPAGKLLPVDQDHVLSLYQHPKLIHIPTGRTVARWPEISSGDWRGCISAGSADEPPAFGWDPVLKRLAVASPQKIQILTLAGS